MSKLRFFNIFFLKPGLTKTFYLMKDFQFSLIDYVCFILENFKKYFMIWVVSAEDFVPYLVGFVWSWAFQKCPKIECSSTFKLASRLSSCAYKQPSDGICGISGVIPCPCGLAQWLEHRHHKASATVAFRKPFYYFLHISNQVWKEWILSCISKR